MSTRNRSRRRPEPAQILTAALVLGGIVGAGAWQRGAGVKPATVDASTATTKAAVPAVTAATVRPGESPAAKAAKASKVTKVAKVLPTAEIEQSVQYQYNAIGRRDPFLPLVDGFIPATEGGNAPVDVGGIKVVGIVWGANSFALVEDGRGNSLILRRGDKVMNGYVEEMRRDAMVAKLTLDGQTQSVVIPLTRKGDRANANR